MNTGVFAFSMSTVTLAVVVTNLFLVITTLCLTNKKLLVRAGYRMIALLLSFSALRLLLPFEFPFTKTIYLSQTISPILSLIRKRYIPITSLKLSVWNLFETVWLLGFLFCIIRYIIRYHKTRQQIVLYGKDLTKAEPYRKIIDKICTIQKRKNTFQIIELPFIDSPVIFGILRPRILLPEHFDLATKDLFFILSHEASHHFHHDLLVKFLSQILIFAYWWNPFGILLNKQTDVILEMRIDDVLTQADVSKTIDYMKCLITVAEQASDYRPFSSSACLGFCNVKRNTRSDLLKRFELMNHNQQKSALGLNCALFSISLVLYLLSYCFLWEPSTAPSNAFFLENEAVEDMNFIVPGAGESYFIENSDGTYDFYMMGSYIETVDSLEYYEDSIPVYPDPSMVPQ